MFLAVSRGVLNQVIPLSALCPPVSHALSFSMFLSGLSVSNCLSSAPWIIYCTLPHVLTLSDSPWLFLSLSVRIRKLQA